MASIRIGVGLDSGRYYNSPHDQKRLPHGQRERGSCAAIRAGAAKAQHVYWLGISDGPFNEASVERAIKSGRMIGSGEKAAEAGRRITKRPQPY